MTVAPWLRGSEDPWIHRKSLFSSRLFELFDICHFWPVHLVWMTARLQQDTFLSWHLAPASEVTRGLTLPF
jgi:hypothetical protein